MTDISGYPQGFSRLAGASSPSPFLGSPYDKCHDSASLEKVSEQCSHLSQLQIVCDLVQRAPGAKGLFCSAAVQFLQSLSSSSFVVKLVFQEDKDHKMRTTCVALVQTFRPTEERKISCRAYKMGLCKRCPFFHCAVSCLCLC